ncbi:MAG: MBL fold metallo-hydrolase [Verrucomicrobiae bacterium]|nr:MBL fold metallo-hydrolase [Verrucomicrobiae bacterium]NNJ85654.1 MBL fold metallo-hydrolase [Akkermansiaceae bacterium]
MKISAPESKLLPMVPEGMSMAVLGSGSGGNATLIRCGDTHVLVDAGLSAKQLVLRMDMLGVVPEQLDAILLTHEHSDHARGVDVLLRKREVPVFANALTREALSHKMKSPVPWKIFQSGQNFQLGELLVNAFRIPHDAAEPVGFVFTGKQTRLSMVSDVGHVTHLMREHLRDCDGIYVEANYDQTLLDQDTKRPWATKQRIASRHGHLSNNQTAELLAEVACDRLKVVMLSHLSSDCNCPDIASQTVGSTFRELGFDNIRVHCAHQHQPTGWVAINASAPSEPNGQPYQMNFSDNLHAK